RAAVAAPEPTTSESPTRQSRPVGTGDYWSYVSTHSTREGAEERGRALMADGWLALEFRVTSETTSPTVHPVPRPAAPETSRERYTVRYGHTSEVVDTRTGGVVFTAYSRYAVNAERDRLNGLEVPPAGEALVASLGERAAEEARDV